MKNYKKALKLTAIILVTLNLSCKNEVNSAKIIKSATSNTVLKKGDKKNITILNNILDKNLITIINQSNEFKLSCAKKNNKVKLTKETLYVEIVEPINYEVEKIEKSNLGFKVYFKDEDFFYDVSIIDKDREVYYWKNLSTKNGQVDDDYSFYTIEEHKLSKINLKREDCRSDQVLSDQSTWKLKCPNSDDFYFRYSNENNEGSLSGILRKDYSFSITGKVEKKGNLFEFKYGQNYSTSSESESEQFWNDFSSKEKIADIKILNDNQIEFTWYGFFNDKTKKREYTKNPFTYNGEGNTIILEKCK